jgi:hypothetical protein
VHHGPIQVFGSGPAGYGSKVCAAGMSMRFIPPSVVGPRRVCPMVLYI